MTQTAAMAATPDRMNRWSARLFPLARGLVLLLILFSIGTLLLGIALFMNSGGVTLSRTLIPNARWTLEMTQAAIAELGWSPAALSWCYAVLGWLAAGAYCAVGLVVYLRKQEGWFGLYVAFMFAVLFTSGGLTPEMVVPAGPILRAWQEVTSLLAWQLLFVLFYLFPDGRFVPSWTRWLLVAWVGVNVVMLLAPRLEGITTPLLAALVFSTMACQIYRYFRRSDAIQRQQTKWIVYMVAVLVLIFSMALLTFTVLGPKSQSLGTSFLVATSVQILMNLWLLLFPIVVAIAILKYRLWDIDIIIRRSLVYVPLTAILAGVLAASMKVTQTLFSSPDGHQSDAVAVLTTLIVVAAFEPIKRWLQRIVDARFKELPNPLERWDAYGEQVRRFAEISDPAANATRLLQEAVAVFEAMGGAVYLATSGEMRRVHEVGEGWDVPAVTIPLEQGGIAVGRLSLAARRHGKPYEARDRELLERNARVVAGAIALVAHREPPAAPC